MSENKVEELTPEQTEEHPARRAAAIVKGLHEAQIKMIDEGTIFTKDGVDVSQEMRQKCLEEIEACDRIIERAKLADPALWAPSFEILREAEETVAEKNLQLEQALKGATVPAEEELPEIGNYDQEP